MNGGHRCQPLSGNQDMVREKRTFSLLLSLLPFPILLSQRRRRRRRQEFQIKQQEKSRDAHTQPERIYIYVYKKKREKGIEIERKRKRQSRLGCWGWRTTSLWLRPRYIPSVESSTSALHPLSLLPPLRLDLHWIFEQAARARTQVVSLFPWTPLTFCVAVAGCSRPSSPSLPFSLW